MTDNNSSHFAQFLLEKGFLLTALEFHQELQEQGEVVESLKKQFETSTEILKRYEQLKPDSVDVLLKEKNERLSFLEGELREAKDTLNSLKSELNRAKQDSRRGGNSGYETSSIIAAFEAEDSQSEDIKATERRALNYISRKYLVEQGYKLTAITFAEEAEDQDLEDWSSVGLETSEPPSLLSFYRTFYTAGTKGQNRAIAEALNRAQKENEALKHKLASSDEKYLQLSKQYEASLKQHQEALEQRLRSGVFSPAETKDQEQQPSNPVQVQPEDKKGHQPPQTHQAPHSHPAERPKEAEQEKAAIKRLVPRSSFADVNKIVKDPLIQEDTQNRVIHQLLNIGKRKRDPLGVVKIVADSLPHILPGVILKKREELIPVILSVIGQHPEQNARYTLTKMLFNLLKKPNEYERKMIVEGFITLANITTEERTETELLPQCWEEVSNKHPERRILIAYACGSLAAYVRPELRPSLILSILQQLCQDKDETVRQAGARNLALLVTLFEGNDKYSQVESVLFDLLNDPSLDVRAVAESVLLPLFTDWSDSLNLLQDSLLSKFLSEIEGVMSTSAYKETSNINCERDNERLLLLFEDLGSVLPRLNQTVLLSAPFAAKDLAKLQAEQLTPEVFLRIQGAFNSFLGGSTEAGEWRELGWVLNTLVPAVIGISLRLGDSNPKLINSFSSLIGRFASSFGQVFAERVLLARFGKVIEESASDPQRRSLILPCYLVGVLGSLSSRDFVKHLKELIVLISLEESGWSRDHQKTLKDSISVACSKSMERKQEILNLLWDLIVHPANHVRHCIVQTFVTLLPILNSEEVVKKVLPGLVTLGGDPEAIVRSSSIQAFGNVALSSLEDQAILDKVGTQLEAFLESEGNRSSVIKVFTAITPHVPGKFRDKYILPSLLKVSEKEHSVEGRSADHKKVNQLLFESFRAFNGCVIDEEAITHFILPGLINIQADADASYKHMLDSMISDMQNAVRHDEPKSKQEDQSAAYFNASNLMGKGLFSKVSSGWAMPSMSMTGRKKE